MKLPNFVPLDQRAIPPKAFLVRNFSEVEKRQYRSDNNLIDFVSICPLQKNFGGEEMHFQSREAVDIRDRILAQGLVMSDDAACKPKAAALNQMAMQIQFLIDVEVIKSSVEKVSASELWVLQRAYTARGISAKKASEYRGSFALLMREAEPKHFNRETAGFERKRETPTQQVLVEDRFFYTYGFSPCNNKPQLPLRQMWWGNRTELIPLMVGLDLGKYYHAFVPTMVLANAFSLTPRAAARAKIIGPDDRLVLQLNIFSSSASSVPYILHPQAQLQRRAAKFVRNWIHRFGANNSIYPERQSREKFVRWLEGELEARGVFPQDTDCVLSSLPHDFVEKTMDALEKFMSQALGPHL